MGNAEWIRILVNRRHVYLKQIDDETLLEIRIDTMSLTLERKPDVAAVKNRIGNSINIDIAR